MNTQKICDFFVDSKKLRTPFYGTLSDLIEMLLDENVKSAKIVNKTTGQKLKARYIRFLEYIDIFPDC